MAQEIADSKLIDTWSSSGLIVKPDISKIIEGWQLGEQPPHEYMNWLQNTFGSKLNHILKNGVASWNNTTQYLAGSSVQHNGNVWLCKTTNTNSAPTDANANWKRIITIEALENLLVGYVATTGDQTIAGVKTFSSSPISSATQSTNANALTKYSAVVKNTGDETIAGIKTFSSSPIVPAPTTDNQVANKKYVDDNIEATWVANDSRAKTALNASGTAPIYACRAWVNFNGQGTVAIRASGNVSSITDYGVGAYTVNFTTAMPDSNYSVSFVASNSTPYGYVCGVQPYGQLTTSFDIFNNYTDQNYYGVYDFSNINLSVFR